MKMAAKQGGAPETIFDHEMIKEAWQAVAHLLSNEEVERKAAAAALKRETLTVRTKSTKTLR